VGAKIKSNGGKMSKCSHGFGAFKTGQVSVLSSDTIRKKLTRISSEHVLQDTYP
jgi:hypothetical protein